MNITETYQAHAINFPDRPAIISEQETISYKNWYERVEMTATAFTRQPYQTKRLAIFLKNSPLFLQLFTGAALAGWANAIGDLRWKENEIFERLNLIEPDIIIADTSLKGKLQYKAAKIIFSDEITHWLKDSYKNNVIVKENQNLPFYIGFTSGSTGKPKAFVRSHQSWIESFRCNQIDLKMTDEEHVVIPGSFASSTFLYAAISTLYLGGTAYMFKKFSPKKVINTIEKFPITSVYLVPTIIQALLQRQWQSMKELNFISTGAKLPLATIQAIQKNFPAFNLYEFYGASELSFVTLLKHENEVNHHTSVGKPVHNAEIMICDENGQAVANNQMGILYVKSNMVFDKYINNKSETDKVRHGAWSTVSDLAKQDDQGYIYLLGRQNESILYGGMTIFPQEIEATLKNMIGVEDVVVFGVHDKYWGEKIVACVKGAVSEHDLKSYCLKHLTNYKTPRVWYKFDDFPQTVTEKIDRRSLKAWVEGGIK